MKLRFWIDPDSALPHIHTHGVTEDEVRQVVQRPGLNFRGQGNSRTIMGQTLAGRFLKVVFVPDESLNSGFVVTAYELRGKALRAYKRARRKRKP